MLGKAERKQKQYLDWPFGTALPLGKPGELISKLNNKLN